MGYIGAHGVNALHRYKYSGVDHSYLAKYVLQPFWSRFVTFFPLWMPPNMITLMGFMFLLISASLGYIYSPQLDSPPPRWVHFAHGLLLFLYQTFDAVDGKQARRTNSSSPLGELFDHVGGIGFWEHCYVRKKYVLVLGDFSCSILWSNMGALFYQHTNPSGSKWADRGTDADICGTFLYCYSAEWWAQDVGKSIPLLGWVPFIDGIPTYGAVLFLMILFAVIPTITFNVQNVYKIVRLRHGSMLKALAMLVPFGVLLAVVLLWDHMSPYDLIGKYPHMVVMGIGQAFGFLVGRMILAHLCDEPKGLKTSMCMSLFYLPLAIANALTAWLNEGIPLVDEKWVLLAFCLYTGALYLHFATSVIHDITTALGIYCFRITRKEA